MCVWYQSPQYRYLGLGLCTTRFRSIGIAPLPEICTIWSRPDEKTVDWWFLAEPVGSIKLIFIYIYLVYYTLTVYYIYISPVSAWVFFYYIVVSESNPYPFTWYPPVHALPSQNSNFQIFKLQFTKFQSSNFQTFRVQNFKIL